MILLSGSLVLPFASTWHIFHSPVLDNCFFFVGYYFGEIIIIIIIVVVVVVVDPWNRVFPEKLPDPQPVKKFSVFYGMRRFVTAFTSARYLSLS